MRVLGRAAVLVALGAVAVSPRAGAQSVVVGPLPSSMSAIPGASITVPVVADLTSSGGASLGSVALRLTWHAGTLTYVSTGVGALGSPAVNSDSTSAGILKFALANAGGATGMPVLITATFNVTGAPADTTILGLSVGEITAAGTFADLEPITAATRASFCTSTGTWGDVDADGAFTGHDALVMLTNAVGLPIAPYSVVNGDVDGSGTVDTRDALVVLSEAVGIPVTQFRIGHLNAGLCSLRSAATVQIQPRTPTVAPGDSLPVTATVKDSTGALVQGVGVVWQTKDSTVVRPGAGGSLVAVAPGTTYAFVYVQPGVKDSVAVTVTPTRHVWYVNPMVAAGNLGVELGSQLYPYASIDTAMAHAAARDTVRVAVADYGPVHITKPLTVLGDSTAAGFPRLSSATASPAGPALRVDSVLSGAVEIRGLRLLNSQKGLVATAGQTLVLGSISVEGARDVGIAVYGVDSLRIARSSVVGAVGTGISVDSVRSAVVDSVGAAAIASPGGGGVPYGLHVWNGTSLRVDSLVLGEGGAELQSFALIALRRLHVRGVQGRALHAAAPHISVADGDVSGAVPPGGGTPLANDSASYAVVFNASTAVRLDSTTVHDNGLFGLMIICAGADSLRTDSIVRNYSQPGVAAISISPFTSLRIVGGTFAARTPALVTLQGLPHATAHVDSTLFDSTSVNFGGLDTLAMRGGAIVGADTLPLWVKGVSTVALSGVEVTGGGSAGGFTLTGGPYAILVQQADSVALDSLWVHDNAASAVWVDTARAIVMYGSRIENNQLAAPSGSLYTVRLDGFRRVRVAQTVIDHGAAGAIASLSGMRARLGPDGGARVQVDSSTILGGYAVDVEGISRTLNDTVGMVGMHAGPALGQRTQGVYVANVGFLEAMGIAVDSSSWAGTALRGDVVGGFDVRGSSFTHTGGAVYLYADTFYVGSTPTHPGPGVFDGNTIACDSAISAVQYVVNLGAVAPATVTNNVLHGYCVLGIVATNGATGAPQGSAVMTGNFVSSLSSAIGPPFVAGGSMLSLQGSYLNPVVADNTTAPGVLLVSDNGTLGPGMDSLRVERNTVRGNWRGGIYMIGKLRATTLRDNVVDSVPSNASYAGIYMGLTTAGTTTHLFGNTVRRALKDGFLLPATDTTVLDSNVVVDSRTAVSIGSAKVVGHWNFFARDSAGLSGSTGSFVQIDSSIIMQSITGRGAKNSGATPWDLGHNYWGSALGPSCPSGCAASAGDSIIGPATALSYTQFLTSAPGSVPTGAPPAFRVAAPLTARLSESSMSAGATRAVNPLHRASLRRSRAVVLPPAAAAVLDRRPMPARPEVIW